MRIGFWTGNDQPWNDILATADRAEKLGYDSVWFADHFLPFGETGDGQIQEAWTVLAGLAAAVPRVRLGPLVSGNTYRNPAVLMKMATTVDQISGGRVVLGLGAGWQENEHIAFGIDFPSVQERCDRLEEAARIIVAMRDQDRPSIDGEHYRIVETPLVPKPVQAKMPLLIGGTGEKRTLRTAGMYADEWNAWADPQTMRDLNPVLDAHARTAGRDPGDIERSAVTMVVMNQKQEVLDKMRARDFGRPVLIGTPAEVLDGVGEFVDAGTDELIVPDFTFGPLDRRFELMEQFAIEVVAKIR